MKNTLLLVLTMVLVASFSWAQETTPAVKVTGDDDLVREKGRFRDTWVHPNADFTRYSKLLLSDTQLQFREVEEKRFSTVGSLGKQTEFAMSGQEREKFRQVVSDTFVGVLERSKKFQLVEEVGPDTLILRVSILDIVSYYPSARAGRVDVHMAVVGEGTLCYELIDSATGVIQARVGERSRIRPPGGELYGASSTPVYTMSEYVIRWSRNVAINLRRGLEKAQGGRRL